MKSTKPKTYRERVHFRQRAEGVRSRYRQAQRHSSGARIMSNAARLAHLYKELWQSSERDVDALYSLLEGIRDAYRDKLTDATKSMIDNTLKEIIR